MKNELFPSLSDAIVFDVMEHYFNLNSGARTERYSLRQFCIRLVQVPKYLLAAGIFTPNHLKDYFCKLRSNEFKKCYVSKIARLFSFLVKRPKYVIKPLFELMVLMAV